MTQCSQKTCYWPEVGCDLGHPDPTQCPLWERDNALNENIQGPSDDIVMPWSGNALGLADLGFVAGRGKPFVLALLGPENAGKTTLLAAWYLLLGRGLYPVNGFRFSGSYSLSGWESIAGFLRWSPGPIQPVFPPHTTSGGKRIPGLLHLAFMQDGGRRRDYVVTDAPGEWFRKWAINRDTSDAKGARWVAEHADAFLLIADCDALSGAGMGKARGDFQMLARRLETESRGRPVALVWTKTDVVVSGEMEEAIRNAVYGWIPDVLEFRVSVAPTHDKSRVIEDGLFELLDWVLNIRRSPVVLPELADDNRDPFFLFGGKSQ